MSDIDKVFNDLKVYLHYSISERYLRLRYNHIDRSVSFEEFLSREHSVTKMTLIDDWRWRYSKLFSHGK